MMLIGRWKSDAHNDRLPTSIYDIYDDYFDHNLCNILLMNESNRSYKQFTVVTGLKCPFILLFNYFFDILYCV